MNSNKVTIQSAGAKGRGVFAAEPIPKGEVLSEWCGGIISAPSALQLPNTPPEYAQTFSIQCGKTEYILPAPDDIAHVFNHSCEPNCGIQALSPQHYILVTMRDIATDEELVWDYEMSEDSDWRIDPCLCGKKTCRKIIGAYRNLPAALRKKYHAYTAPWLIEKYGRP